MDCLVFGTKVNKNMGKYIKKIKVNQASAVMDSEGNSDPIASSATSERLPEAEEGDHFGVVLYSEPLEKEPKAYRKLSKQTKRTHRYKSSWEQIDAFKEWIQPSDKPEYLAFCLVCNAYLKGASGRNDITKHSKTEVHLKNIKYNLKTASDHKPRSLKKRQMKADARLSPVTPSKSLKQEVQAPESEFEFCGIDSVDEEYTPTDKKPAKRETVDVFKQWIQPSDKPDYLAYCSLCKVYLKGSSERNDITKHLQTEVHLSHIKSDLRKEQTDDDEPNPIPRASCSFIKKSTKLETKQNRQPKLMEKCASFIETSRDDSQIFGDYVASAIRDLTDNRNKKRLKLLIQKSIIEVQETDGEPIIQDKTHYPNFYTPASSIQSTAPLLVPPTEEITTANTPTPSIGVLPVQIEAAQGQYRYHLHC